MGLMLFPGDGDTSSPDVSWSYTGFAAFRRWLAEAEGIALDEMHGFGGERPWADVSTTLAPLLDHADDEGPGLTPAQCAALLPRLREMTGQPRGGSADPLVRRHRDDARRLAVVAQICVDKSVELLFG